MQQIAGEGKSRNFVWSLTLLPSPRCVSLELFINDNQLMLKQTAVVAILQRPCGNSRVDQGNHTYEQSNYVKMKAALEDYYALRALRRGQV
jgi:hypothetical protein